MIVLTLRVLLHSVRNQTVQMASVRLSLRVRIPISLTLRSVKEEAIVWKPFRQRMRYQQMLPLLTKDPVGSAVLLKI